MPFAFTVHLGGCTGRGSSSPFNPFFFISMGPLTLNIINQTVSLRKAGEGGEEERDKHRERIGERNESSQKNIKHMYIQSLKHKKEIIMAVQQIGKRTLA